jgi:hypothetical protein
MIRVYRTLATSEESLWEEPVVGVVAPGTVMVVLFMPLEPAAPGGPGGTGVDVVVLLPWINCDAGGNCTGLTNTMMQAMATRHPPAMARTLRLRSVAPSRAARKKPLSRKNRTMLTELRTPRAYQTP